MRALVLAAATSSLVLLGPVTAWAQDVAAAEAQFERGLAAMEKRDFATACPAIEESYRLDPRPGTMFTLAECENKRGRTATAATRYEDYLSFFARLSRDQQQRQGERPRIAAAQREALRARAPRLTIVVPAGLPAGSKVTRDGVVLAAPSWGVALPVDPGERVIRLDVPGHAASERRTVIADGASATVQLQPGPAVGPAPSAPDEPRPSLEGRGDRLTGVQIGGLAVGGVGVVGLGVGAVFGLVTMGHASKVGDDCDDAPGPDGTTRCRTGLGPDAADAASTTGAVSSIAFGVGGAALVTGVAMFLLGADDADEAAGVTPVLAADDRGAFAGARGRF